MQILVAKVSWSRFWTLYEVRSTLHCSSHKGSQRSHGRMSYAQCSVSSVIIQWWWYIDPVTPSHSTARDNICPALLSLRYNNTINTNSQVQIQSTNHQLTENPPKQIKLSTQPCMQIHQLNLAWFCGVLELHPAGPFTLDSRVELMYIRTLFPYFLRIRRYIQDPGKVTGHIGHPCLGTTSVWWTHGSWPDSLSTRYQTVQVSCHNMEYSRSAYAQPAHAAAHGYGHSQLQKPG